MQVISAAVAMDAEPRTPAEMDSAQALPVGVHLLGETGLAVASENVAWKCLSSPRVAVVFCEQQPYRDSLSEALARRVLALSVKRGTIKDKNDLFQHLATACHFTHRHLLNPPDLDAPPLVIIACQTGIFFLLFHWFRHPS